MHPLKRGFDEFFGFLGGAHSYVNALADKANPILRGTEPVDEKEDLAAANPAKAKELQAAGEAWNAQLAAPRWRRPNRARQPGARKKQRSKA